MPNVVSETSRGVTRVVTQGVKALRSLPKAAAEISETISRAPVDVLEKADEAQQVLSQQMTRLRRYAETNGGGAGRLKVTGGSISESGWNPRTQLRDSAEFTKGMMDSGKEVLHDHIFNGPIAEEIRFWKSPYQEFKRRSQEQLDTVKAMTHPVETGRAVKKELKEHYVEPFERGDMRGSGKAFGDLLIIGTEALVSKKLLGPGKADFKPGGKKAGIQSKNGGGHSGPGKTPGNSGSKPGPSGEAGIAGGGKKSSKSKKKKKKSAQFDIAPSNYPTAKHEVKVGGDGGTGPIKPSRMPGKKFETKYVYRPVKVSSALKVNNMSEFFSGTPLGKMLKLSSERTGKTYQSVPVYRMSEKMKIGDVGLQKGDYFYLDKLHGDHVEVFNKKGKLQDVLDLGGNHLKDKVDRARKEGRTIKDLMSYVETAGTFA